MKHNGNISLKLHKTALESSCFSSLYFSYSFLILQNPSSFGGEKVQISMPVLVWLYDISQCSCCCQVGFPSVVCDDSYYAVGIPGQQQNILYHPIKITCRAESSNRSLHGRKQISQRSLKGLTISSLKGKIIHRKYQEVKKRDFVSMGARL